MVKFLCFIKLEIDYKECLLNKMLKIQSWRKIQFWNISLIISKNRNLNFNAQVKKDSILTLTWFCNFIKNLFVCQFTNLKVSKIEYNKNLNYYLLIVPYFLSGIKLVRFCANQIQSCFCLFFKVILTTFQIDQKILNSRKEKRK